MYRNKKQKTTPESAKEALSALLPVLEAQTDWSRDAIFEACKQKAEAMEKKNGGCCSRWALPCPARPAPPAAAPTWPP